MDRIDDTDGMATTASCYVYCRQFAVYCLPTTEHSRCSMFLHKMQLLTISGRCYVTSSAHQLSLNRREECQIQKSWICARDRSAPYCSRDCPLRDPDKEHGRERYLLLLKDTNILKMIIINIVCDLFFITQNVIGDKLLNDIYYGSAH